MKQMKRCPHCDALFTPRRPTSRYCSRQCQWANNGKDQPRKPASWYLNAKGYINGHVWENGVQRHVKQHRYLMEQALGVQLPASVDVHHINGDKSDNRLSNLLVVSHGAHSTMTGRTRTYRRGYKLALTPDQLRARSERAKQQRAAGATAFGRCV